jgi:hypothetical protein
MGSSGDLAGVGSTTQSMQTHLRGELRTTGGNANLFDLISDGKSKTCLLHEAIAWNLKEFGYGG